MKKFLVVVGALFSFQLTAFASSVCVAGSLAAYEGLGTGGCIIGTSTVGSFTNVGGTTGAIEIPPSSVTVTPSGGTTDPTLTFTLSLSANSGQTLEEIFNYVIEGAVYSMETNSLSGSSESGGSTVSNVQNYCVGGTFDATGVSGCTGSSSGTLVTFDGLVNTASATFSATSLLSVTDDFVIDNAGVGSASGGSVSDQVTAIAIPTVPEPEPVVLSLLAFLIVSTRSFYSNKRKIKVC